MTLCRPPFECNNLFEWLLTSIYSGPTIPATHGVNVKMEPKEWAVDLRKLSETAAILPSTPPPVPSHQVSISPTFYELFRTKVLRKAFLYLHFRLNFFWRKNIGASTHIKCCRNWPQVSISPTSYALILWTRVKSAAFLYLKFGFILFWHKIIGVKAAFLKRWWNWLQVSISPTSYIRAAIFIESFTSSFTVLLCKVIEKLLWVTWYQQKSCS